MTGSALAERVQSIIDDPSFDEDRILVFINEGLFNTAALVDIPDLAELATVDTLVDADSVSLPDSYMRDVTRVESVTNEVTVSTPGRVYEYLKFRRRHPVATEGERVTDIAVRKKQLHYYPTPTVAETLQLTFLMNPTDITLSTEPDCLPAHLHVALLASYAAKIIFEMIEDGVEGKQVNVDRQETKYQLALAALASYVGTSDSEPVFIADEDNYSG